VRSFSWEAVDDAGVISRGELRAADEAQLEEQLRKRGLTLVRFLLLRGFARRELPSGRVKKADLAEFARYVSVTSKAGLSIVDSLTDFAARHRDPSVRRVLERVAEDVRGGVPLADAFGKHARAFDPIFVSMVRAGEASGALDSSMLRAAEQLEFQLSVRQQVKAALIPPAILAVAVTGLVVLLITFLLPRLMGVMEGTGVELPAPTRLLLGLSDGLIAYWMPIVGGLVLAVAGLKLALRQPRTAMRVSRLVLRLPAVGPLARMSAEARFTSTMRSLLVSGVDAVRALQMGADTSGSPWLQARLHDTARRVQAGEPLADAIAAVDGLNPLLLRMLQLGEKAGNLQETLETAVEWYAAEIPRAVKRAMQVIEPAIVVCAGATIAFIVLATILPIFSLYDSMS
jgi:type II secretory pathway component PulF